MDKFSFSRHGVSRLPPGFRFQPTDEELVFQYLRCKVFSCPLPASIIAEINVCEYDPWDLPGEMEQERYFFSRKEGKYRNGTRTKRTTNSGYWKATGSDKKIVSSRRNNMVGMKKTLVFHRGKPPHGARTEWIMHEYRLVNAGTEPSILPQIHDSAPQHSEVEVENWVLCRIFLKKGNIQGNSVITQTSTENRLKDVGTAQPRIFNFTMGYETLVADSSSSSSSLSCSSITKVSSNEVELEEGSACSSC